MDFPTNPKTEILVTVGVSEGVDLAMRTLVDPGDQVISPDRGYVAYEADIIFAGEEPVPVPTYAKYDFGVRADEIAAAITPRIKIILIVILIILPVLLLQRMSLRALRNLP